MNSLTRLPNQKNTKLKILYGPTLSIWRPSRLVDEGMITALLNEGNTVFGQYCGKAQNTECNVYGGDWLRDSTFDSKCSSCLKQSKNFWQKINKNGTEPIVLSSITGLEQLVNQLPLTDLFNYSLEGVPFGKLASDITRNNSLVDDIGLAPDYENRLRNQIVNLLTMYKRYDETIVSMEPDRIISNDSYYGMWRVLQYAAAKHCVPFYSTWPITSNRVVFALNEPSMERNLSATFKGVGSETQLGEVSENLISNWHQGRRSLFIPIKTRSRKRDFSELLKQIDSRKSFVLVSNVVWDLASLNKDVAFPSNRAWVQQTVDWFGNHPELFLIIKPHPSEAYGKNPKTRENTNSFMEGRTPSNVFVLPYETFSIQDIVEVIKPSAFLVHTSTVGYEVAMMGRKSICVGRSVYRGLGFTIDVESQTQYFNELLDAANGDGAIDSRSTELAKRFGSLYNHRYQVFVGDLNCGRRAFLERFHKLASDPSTGLNYVLRKIQSGHSIVDESSMPPISG
jgi:hypothetical protein